MKTPTTLAITLIIALGAGGALFVRYNLFNKPALPKNTTKSQIKTAEKSATQAETPAKTEKATAPTFDKTKHSTTDASSIWVIANKQHQLSPADYTPGDLVTISGATISNQAATDFKAMLAAAGGESVTLTAVSGYRSYSTQNTLYDNYVANNGQTAADTFSARPGYSEHQTGLAIDFGNNADPSCNFDDCYANMPDGKWLAAHAHEYGFILRYTSENQQITGYKNEPWHYRYIGRELSAEMKKQAINTLEEFFGVNGGVIYK